MFGNLSVYDNIILVIYFIIVLAIGLYFAFLRGKNETDYFLGGRKLGWIAVGLSLFATNISSEHLYGLSESAAKSGLAVGQFEWTAIIFLILLGWVFAPIFIKSNISTIPEFFGKQFGMKARKFIAGLSIFIYIFTKITITLYAGSIILNEVLNWEMTTSVLLMVLFTGLYTVIGGFTSVVYTQIFQTILLIVGAALLTFFGIQAIGGIDTFISALPEGHLDLFKSISDPEFPWIGIVLGAPILGIWYWCTDQYIVQRILGAKDIVTAKKGTILAAVLKSFPIFLLILPGMIALVLYPNIESKSAYASLINGGILPIGIKGIVLVGLFSALMSSLSSAFNSTSALITLDIYKPMRPEASENEIMLIAKLSTILIVFITIILAHLISFLDNGLYVNLQSFQAYFSPPIVASFLFGIFWKRTNSRVVLTTLLGGSLIGLTRLVSDVMVTRYQSTSAILVSLSSINYLYFALILFFVSSISILLGSLLFSQKESIERIRVKEIIRT